MLVTIKNGTMFWDGIEARYFETGSEHDVSPYHASQLQQMGAVERKVEFHKDCPNWYSDGILKAYGV